MMVINFKNKTGHIDSSQQNGFEELVYQLAGERYHHLTLKNFEFRMRK